MKQKNLETADPENKTACNRGRLQAGLHNIGGFKKPDVSSAKTLRPPRTQQQLAQAQQQEPQQLSGIPVHEKSHII